MNSKKNSCRGNYMRKYGSLQLVGSASNSLYLKSVVMLLFYTAATALPRALDKKNLAPI